MASFFLGLRRAIDTSFAVIEFSPTGKVMSANESFCRLMGYDLKEIVGRHHSIFVPENERGNTDYLDFWAALARGEFQAREFRRRTKSGRDVWIQATYTPILSAFGRVKRVIKLATDITREKEVAADNISIVNALQLSQAVISFDLDGTVLSANETFAKALGYSSEDELVGVHHRTFVPQEHSESEEYKEFWRILRSGNYHAGEFLRRSKTGSDVWIQATYNPIHDINGRITKIVKFAVDVTEQRIEQAKRQSQIDAISRSRAVIEFSPDGMILSVNDNFLSAMKYSAQDVVGKHHSIFVDPDERRGKEYEAFWNDLSVGKFKTGEFRRIDRDGHSVWIEGVYNPIRDPNGRVLSVVKIASVITDQVAARERNDLLSIVTDQTDNSVIITDAYGRIEYINAGFTKLTGYEFSECVGRSPGSLLQGQHTDRTTVERISAKIKARTPFYEEILNYDKRGRPYWISLAVNPVANANGEVERFVSIQSNIDITKRKALEFTRKLQAISQTSAICEWYPNGELMDMNAFVRDLHGKPHALKELIDAGERACLNNGETMRRNITWEASEGREIIFDAVFNSVRDEAGQVNKVIMFGTDVTDRQKAIDVAIHAIRSSSSQISEITEVIEGIANETRILSLNASVEASRAGEAGKGFAIVAAEIRDLAGRTNGSVADIEMLLGENKAMLQNIESSAAESEENITPNQLENEHHAA